MSPREVATAIKGDVGLIPESLSKLRLGVALKAKLANSLRPTLSGIGRVRIMHIVRCKRKCLLTLPSLGDSNLIRDEIDNYYFLTMNIISAKL